MLVLRHPLRIARCCRSPLAPSDGKPRRRHVALCEVPPSIVLAVDAAFLQRCQVHAGADIESDDSKLLVQAFTCDARRFECVEDELLVAYHAQTTGSSPPLCANAFGWLAFVRGAASSSPARRSASPTTSARSWSSGCRGHRGDRRRERRRTRRARARAPPARPVAGASRSGRCAERAEHPARCFRVRAYDSRGVRRHPRGVRPAHPGRTGVRVRALRAAKCANPPTAVDSRRTLPVIT